MINKRFISKQTQASKPLIKGHYSGQIDIPVYLHRDEVVLNKLFYEIVDGRASKEKLNKLLEAAEICFEQERDYNED